MKTTNTTCYVCGKNPISKDEIGLTKKLIGKDSKKFYCLNCLADYLEVTVEELIAKIEEFFSSTFFRSLLNKLALNGILKNTCL